MRIRAYIVRIIKQILKDRRTLAMMLVAPMIILYLLSIVFNETSNSPAISYIGGFGLFVTLQTLVIQTFAIYGLGIYMAGDFVSLLIVNLVLALVALSLGTLLSAFARNEFQMIQFIPLVIVPQILFSGLFPLEDPPIWVKWLSSLLPFTYAADILRDLMLRGKSLMDVGGEIGILLFFSLTFVLLNLAALRRHRRI